MENNLRDTKNNSQNEAEVQKNEDSNVLENSNLEPKTTPKARTRVSKPKATPIENIEEATNDLSEEPILIIEEVAIEVVTKSDKKQKTKHELKVKKEKEKKKAKKNLEKKNKKKIKKRNKKNKKS